MKNKRHEKILEIIKNKPINTQDDLQNELTKFGFNVTQSTVSRDIRELKLVKGHDEDGNYCYVSPKDKQPNMSSDRYKQMISNSVISVVYAVNDVVVKCHPGMAQSACVAIDSAFQDMMIGSIAGDDTIFIITKDSNDASILTGKIKGLM